VINVKRNFLTGDTVMNKGILLTVAVLGSLFVSTQAMAGASANIGATSNYLWRGLEQTEGGAALQGGADYAWENGAYVGTWLSNAKFGGKNGTEVDAYVGYKKELKGDLSYDVGVVKYQYPNDISTDFTEAYAKVGYKGVGAEVDYTVDKGNTNTDEGDLYYGLGYTGEFKNGIGYGAKVGHYNMKDPLATDYSNVQLSLSKSTEKLGDFTLAVDKISEPLNQGKDDAIASVSWKKSFDF
jgi:uncharacterized protein (TIGR02001 family)